MITKTVRADHDCLFHRLRKKRLEGAHGADKYFYQGKSSSSQKSSKNPYLYQKLRARVDKNNMVRERGSIT